MDDPGRERWLEQRSSGIGASDAAAAIGASPWASERSLYEEKVGNIEPDDLTGSERIYWGTALEAPIRDRVSELLGIEVRHAGQYEIVRSSEYPHMTATLDGYFPSAPAAVAKLFDDSGLMPPSQQKKGTLQIKTTSAWNAKEWDERWPIYYQVQCQHELVVAEYDWGILAVLIGGQELRLLPFLRDESFCEALIATEAAFWQRVKDREPPEADGSAATAAVLAKLYPDDDGEIVDLPAEAEIWDTTLREAKAEKKEAEKRIKDAEAKLKDAIGEATVGVLPTGDEYTWAKQQRAEHVCKASSFRVLRRRKA